VRDYSTNTNGNLNFVHSKNFFEPFLTTSKGIFSQSEKPIAFNNGLGQVLDSSNQYVFPILRAEQTTFSYNEENGNTAKASGDGITLVSGYQTRNNQRVSISGSIGMCSNDNMHKT